MAGTRPLFYQLAHDQGETEAALQDPRFTSLVEEIEVEGKIMRGLTAMGQLFHGTFRYRFRLERNLLLPPDSGLDPEQKKIHYEPGLGPRPFGIETWFQKLLQLPYVTRIHTFYYNADLPRKNYFKASTPAP